MRINAYIALATGLSRRQADSLISQGKVSIGSTLAKLGMQVQAGTQVTLDNKVLKLPDKRVTILLNKPAGFVVSRKGQGAKTIYDLLPEKYSALKPIGRLDKESSGLIMLTNDGKLANSLTHPSMAKQKVYQITLDKPLTSIAKSQINQGVRLEDGLSHLKISNLSPDSRSMSVTMSEGRNRQIRRTFASLGYQVTKLHRIKFGQFSLTNLKNGQWLELKSE